MSIVSFYKCNCRVCIALFYRPPSSPIAILEALFAVLQSLDPALFSTSVLLGDFYSEYYNPGHHLYSRLHSLISTFSLTQTVPKPTHLGSHGGSLIDLVFLSQPNRLSYCSTIPPLENSDHQGVSVKLKWRVSSKQLTAKSRTIWRYKYADFRSACHLLDKTNWDQILPEYVNTAWDLWQQEFMELSIPKSTLRKRSNLPWLNKSIVQAIRRRCTTNPNK